MSTDETMPSLATAAVAPAGPEQQDAATPTLGVCLSGGGSRAMSAALGALSGLHTTPDPDDPTRTMLQRVAHISSVSGGTWAAVPYTFLPDTIGGRPIDDDTFLLTPVEPDQLVKAGGDDSPGNVEFMDPRSLGSGPQRFSPDDIVRALGKLYKWGFFTNSEKWSWFWSVAIGELILGPFELYDARYERRSDATLPSKFFSSSDEHIESAITTTNHALTPSQFHTVRPGRPSLVVNFNLLLDEDQADPVQVPVQATPTVTGILGSSPEAATLEGGGSVESFGFTSTLLPGPPGVASIGLDRRYALSDITSCSSAFFAEDLLSTLNDRADKFGDAIVDALRNVWVPRFIGRLFVRWLGFRARHFLDCDAARVIPRYPYWPIGEVGGTAPTSRPRGFSDGGNFEDTGVLGMLARTDANRIVAFVNGAEPLQRLGNGEIRIDGQIATLFGYYTTKTGYASYGGMQPDVPHSWAQVFSDSDGEFDDLRRELWKASTGGGDEPGKKTMMHCQELTTVPNRVAHIAGGRKVTVLWVVNERVDEWQDAITDEGIRADLAAGQGDDPHGPLANFPYFETAKQVHLDAEAVNMLGQLSAWNVRQAAGEIAKMLSR